MRLFGKTILSIDRTKKCGMPHIVWFILCLVAVVLIATPLGASVELDADDNGYLDVNRGGLNQLLIQEDCSGITAGYCMDTDTGIMYCWDGDSVEECASLMTDGELASIRDLTSAADTFPYFTGSGTASLADLTAFARTILDDEDAATVGATLGLEIGTDVQEYDADLTTYAGITPSTDVQSVLGAATYAAIRALLDLEVGTDVQAYHDALQSISGLTETNGGILYGTADDTYSWLAAGAEGTLLMGNGAGAPSWLAAGTSGYTLVAAGAADPVWTQYLTVSSGGTGVGSLTDGGVLLGSGTGAITPMAVLGDGEMIVGDGTTDPVAESGATLRTSIGVGSGDSPQLAGIELSHATENTLTASGGVLSIEGVDAYMVGDEDAIAGSMSAEALANNVLTVTAGDSYGFSGSAADDTVDELMAAIDTILYSHTAQKMQELTDGANISWDMDSGGFAYVTLGGDRTLDNPTNVEAGGMYRLKVVQDATGSRTLSYGVNFKFPGGVEPTLSSGASDIDLLEFIAYDSSTLYLVNFLADLQ